MPFGISVRRMRGFLLFVWVALVTAASASVEPYLGAIGGLATLSADAGAQRTSSGLQLSSYSPDNGGALNLFIGVHLDNWFSVQGNYIWNQNNLVLNSAASGSNTFYQQARASSQYAGVIDLLIYFRPRGNWIRPYLGTGIGVIHLTSREIGLLAFGGTPVLPPARFSSLRPVFRSHVGIDLRISRRVDFRYSFSEMIGKNDISKHLSPPAPRRLANFQNLFGFVLRF